MAQARPPVDTGEPAAVLAAEKTWAGSDVLLPFLASADEAARVAAIRALGRLEEPAVVPQLLQQLDSPNGGVRAAAARAIAQALHGVDPAPDADLVRRSVDRLLVAADHAEVETAAAAATSAARIALVGPDQATAVERALAKILERTRNDRQHAAIYAAAIRGFESLARLNPKLVSFAPETADRLGAVLKSAVPHDAADAKRNALAALMSARALDDDTERLALHDSDELVRRLAMTVLAGGAGLDDGARAELIVEGLQDGSALVRYEALRAYVRRVANSRGCGPVLDALRDDSSHVVLLAVDALGDVCKDDEDVTMRVVAETRTPPTIGSWHRPTHALVSLAKRSRERAAISIGAFAGHPVWQVRMYAARAAAVMEDANTLQRLAYDENDNVREAALEPLTKIDRDKGPAALVAALGRRDYQLLRSASVLLKEQPADRKLAPPLIDALRRVTRERKETSRDTRLALLDALSRHGTVDDADALVPLLKDFDPKVAAVAASTIGRWTGKTPVPEPIPIVRAGRFANARLHQCVSVRLKSGGRFSLTMAPSDAPVTVDRFLELAIVDRYYDGLTFHRVVPAFVIQGGSPGANEYAGQADFMRDEIGGANTRGSVGVSTRGRNTGDAQFFVNLVDNPRLDLDYTVFAHVVPADMPVVDAIEEGDAIENIRTIACAGPR